MLESADGPLVVKLIDFGLSKVCSLFFSVSQLPFVDLLLQASQTFFLVLDLSNVVPSCALQVSTHASHPALVSSRPRGKTRSDASFLFSVCRPPRGTMCRFTR